MFDLAPPALLFSQHFTTDFVGDEVLTINERKATGQFSGKRLKDFSTGRYCARKALAHIGLENADILVGDEKQPLWPAGYVGSISHSGKLIGAVAAKSSQVKSIGLDIETIGKIKPEMWRLLYTKAETEFLKSFTGEELAYYTTLLFSFKEAFYKLQYPLTKTFLDFTDVEIKSVGNKFKLGVLKEFSGKQLLSGNLSLHHTSKKDQLITLCYLM
ncbi:MAG: 4'-phosphopantetheinyl transferase superfamily protein [Sphingobacteriaceae bacterium]|nr:MAG: 4'-phosphopantetheinyl transferase superfamily protein [Sphingobacteriaceae bacterium]